jgi:hypothetical protein
VTPQRRKELIDKNNQAALRLCGELFCHCMVKLTGTDHRPEYPELFVPEGALAGTAYLFSCG